MLRCVYLNIQGFTSNFAEFESCILVKKFEIIVLSESHLTQDIEDNEVYIEGYSLIRCDSSSRHTGGLCVYIKKDFQFEVVKKVVVNKDIWWLVIKMFGNEFTMYIVAVYKSPRASNRQFCDKFSEWLDDLCDDGKKFMIVGDVNIDWLDENDIYRNDLKQVIEIDNNCKQIISGPTRITNTSRKLIDYVVTNSEAIKAEVCSDLNISDHETIVIKIKIGKDMNTATKPKIIRYLRYNKQIYVDEIKNSEIVNAIDLEDPNKIALIFQDEILRITNKFVISKVIKNKSNEWFNGRLGQMKYEKIAKYNKAILSNKSEDWDSYRVTRNRYKNEIERAKNENIKMKLINANDQKSMWRVIKKYVLNENTRSIEKICFNGIYIKKESDIADEFNKFFVRSITEIHEEIEKVQYTSRIAEVNNRFKFQRVSLKDLSEVLKSLNQKKDFNFISAKMMLDVFDVIGPVLVRLANESMMRGQFPDSWKESVITPIEKVKGSIKCEEFRPVNALPTYEKILEKIVHKQLEEYFEKNNLFFESQSGFRKKHSCESALNHILVNWKEEIAEKNKVIAVFLDLKRAFETIDRDILLRKLRCYGIRDEELEWFRTYLMNRAQTTNVNGKASQRLITILGVLQGSILGAFLFIVYINDMVQVLLHCKLALFADDALIFIAGSDVKECGKKMQEDLTRLNRWLKENKLKLNVSKTKCMVFKEQHNLNLNIDSEQIEQVTDIKYLGVIVDYKMKFDLHVEFIVRKIAKKIGFFRRIRNRITLMSAINVYNTMIKPHFEYCATILYLSNENSKSRLQRLQNKAMRAILLCNRYTSISYMLETLQWLSVRQRIVLNVLLFIFKIKHHVLPNYLTRYVRYVGESQPYELRNVGDFRLRYGRDNSSQNSLMYNGFKLFNELPEDTKRETNVCLFKKKAIEFVKIKFKI